MKKIFLIAGIAFFTACKDSKNSNENKPVEPASTTATDNSSSSSTTVPDAGTASIAFSVAGAEKTINASVLVQKDQDKLSPGNDRFAMITANGANSETITVNFLFASKPGIYPVVGLAYTREKQVFGGILGGKPKITDYKVNLTECTDLGANNSGGHKWKLSGHIEGDVVINAMGMMKIDTTHPASVTVSNIRFANLSYDDNWEELLKEGMKKLKN